MSEDEKRTKDPADKPEEISDDQLEDVSGGFVQRTAGRTLGTGTTPRFGKQQPLGMDVVFEDE